MKDQGLEVGKIEECQGQPFTTKWFNTNQKLYSMHLQNLSQMLRQNQGGSRRYNQLIDLYLKQEKQFQKMFQREEKPGSSALAKQNQESQLEIKQNEEKINTLWKQIQQKNELNQKQALENMLIFTALKQLLSQYAKVRSQYESITQSKDSETNLDILTEVEQEKQMKLEKLTKIKYLMGEYDQLLNVLNRHAQEKQNMARNKTVKESIENMIRDQPEFNEISKLYKERSQKIGQIDAKVKKMEDLRLQIQQKQRKMEVLKHRIALIGSYNPLVCQDSVDNVYDKGYQTDSEARETQEYVPKINRKVVYKQKNTTERRVVLVIWFILLMGVNYMLS